MATLDRKEWKDSITVSDARSLLFQLMDMLEMEVQVKGKGPHRTCLLAPKGFSEFELSLRSITDEYPDLQYFAEPVSVTRVKLRDSNGYGLTGTIEEARNWIHSLINRYQDHISKI